MTVKEYAKFHGVKYDTYKYWVRKYSAEQKQRQNKSASSSFIPVHITAKKSRRTSFGHCLSYDDQVGSIGLDYSQLVLLIDGISITNLYRKKHYKIPV